jgi:hypothetical protein
MGVIVLNSPYIYRFYSSTIKSPVQEKCPPIS